MNRMYYWLVKLAFISILGLMFAGCDKKKEDEISLLTVDKRELSFSQKGESQEFNITYTDTWYLEAEGIEGYFGINMAGVKDFTILPASNKGNTKVIVTLIDEITESYDIDLNIVGENNRVVIKLKAIANPTGR